jgi:hypothetical protein
MHKAVILLVKANNRESALTQAREFLEEYKEVWDWYVIGGRYTQLLSKHFNSFMEKAKAICPELSEEYIITSKLEEHKNEFQSLWLSLGGTGLNPYANHYECPKNGNDDDVVYLCECIDIVREWQQTIKTAKEEEEKAKKWLEKNDYNMYGYALKKAGNLYQQNFCSNTNIYNVDSFNYSIPKDMENYYAVMIDMHH